jgi:hypothetical protein
MKTSTLMIIPCLLWGLNQPWLAANPAPNSFDNYYKECLQRVRGQGLALAIAEDICQCTIAEFKKLYSLKNFTKIVQKSKTDKALARQLAQVGENCFFEQE